MLSRRGFLNGSGLGILAASFGCRPPAWSPAAMALEAPTGRLARLTAMKAVKERFLGYPVNMNDPLPEFFDWRRQLFDAGIDAFAFNNVGNPFRKSPIPYNTHEFEREAILAFADIIHFPKRDTWGFLSHSGTDSNMHGMYMGRTLLKGRTGVLPKAYYTREAHYSVQILSDLLGLESVQVKTRADAGMDPDDLARQLAVRPDEPALIVATIGTTFKGAIDDVDLIRPVLADRDHYLHLDAALFGGYLPYTEHAATVSAALPGEDGNDSNGTRYDSIAVSCHKFFGFPSPAGLFVTRRSLYDEFNSFFRQIHNPEYIHQVPGTITCSRDAVKPAEFYFYTTPIAVTRQQEDARLMLVNTTYLHDQLRTHLPEYKAVRSNPLSNTIYFRHPGDAIVEKYSLATMHLEKDNKAEAFAHAIVMPHVSQTVLDEFLSDLQQHKSSLP